MTWLDRSDSLKSICSEDPMLRTSMKRKKAQVGPSRVQTHNLWIMKRFRKRVDATSCLMAPYFAQIGERNSLREVRLHHLG